MEPIGHRIDWDWKVWEPQEPHLMWSRPQSQSSLPYSPPKRVLLDYVLQTFPCNIFQPCNPTVPSTVVYGDPVIPFFKTREIIDRDDLLFCTDQTRQIVLANLLELLRYGPSMRIDYEQIVNEVVSISSIACCDVENAGRETIPVSVRIRIFHVSIFEERELIQQFADDIANADTEFGMVPASKRSIRDLETKKIEGPDTAKNCVVCLEQFCSGTEVTSMPCSHMFHQECITKWLETNHHCPICRFKMPTEKEGTKTKTPSITITNFC